MIEQKMQDLALFRFSLIAPVVNQTYTTASKMQYFRDVAAKEHVLPNSKNVVKFSSSTIKKWYLNYQKGGFDALVSKPRLDAGIPRVLTNEATKKIHDLKENFPYITGKLIYQKLLEEGYVKAANTSLASVLRYIRDNNLKGNQIAPVERKAFEMEFSNDCWQGDSSHGPVIKVNGQKHKTYLISFIDDASRILAHGEFFFNDNAVNMQIVLKKAISKYGVPKRLYVDNGGPYKNDQLNLICASLGIVLIHTPPYSPQNKGKIERVFRTIKDNWINGCDWNQLNSLESLNLEFNKYLHGKYMNSIHSSLEITPRQRYLKDYQKIKFIASQKLDADFLHRVVRKVNNDATVSLNSTQFEVPQKYIGQRISMRYSPIDLSKAYIFNHENTISETVYPLNKIDNSKVKRAKIDYSKICEIGDELNV
jgi:putative transposase